MFLMNFSYKRPSAMNKKKSCWALIMRNTTKQQNYRSAISTADMQGKFLVCSCLVDERQAHTLYRKGALNSKKKKELHRREQAWSVFALSSCHKQATNEKIVIQHVLLLVISKISKAAAEAYPVVIYKLTNHDLLR